MNSQTLPITPKPSSLPGQRPISPPPSSPPPTPSPNTPALPHDQALALVAPTCPACHTQVRPTDYYCFNCGQDLQQATKPISWVNLFATSLGSLLFPPLGIVWGIRYLKKPNPRAKLTGELAIGLTVISMIALALYMVNLIDYLNQEVARQMENLQQF